MLKCITWLPLAQPERYLQMGPLGRLQRFGFWVKGFDPLPMPVELTAVEQEVQQSHVQFY